jgi:hypothetical protein
MKRSLQSGSLFYIGCATVPVGMLHKSAEALITEPLKSSFLLKGTPQAILLFLIPLPTLDPFSELDIDA